MGGHGGATRRETLSLLDVGCGWGSLAASPRHQATFRHIAISAADVSDAALYRKDLYRDYFIGDLTGGYPEIPSEHYDVVVCEQVLEHLAALDAAIATLVRLLRPGGTLVIGVPIFPPPLHLARKHLVAIAAPRAAARRLDASAGVFARLVLRELRKQPALTVETVRGFRIVSGGLLRPLENYRWWWRFTGASASCCRRPA